MSAALTLYHLNTAELSYDLSEAQKDIQDCECILARDPQNKSAHYRLYATRRILAAIQSELQRRKETIQ